MKTLIEGWMRTRSPGLKVAVTDSLSAFDLRWESAWKIAACLGNLPPRGNTKHKGWVTSAIADRSSGMTGGMGSKGFASELPIASGASQV
jgi:hypothetical protein